MFWNILNGPIFWPKRLLKKSLCTNSNIYNIVTYTVQVYNIYIYTWPFLVASILNYIPFLNSLLKNPSSSHYSLFCHWLILCSGYLPLDTRKNRQFISQAAFWRLFRSHRQLLEGFFLIEIAAEIIHISKSLIDANIFPAAKKGKVYWSDFNRPF